MTLEPAHPPSALARDERSIEVGDPAALEVAAFIWDFGRPSLYPLRGQTLMGGRIRRTDNPRSEKDEAPIRNIGRIRPKMHSLAYATKAGPLDDP